MYGVDLSPTMRRLAREKSRLLGLPLRVVDGDMRDFRLPEPVDLVLCEFDALNHVEEKGDLALVGRAVSRALRPGGHFYFDVNNRLAFETIWPGTWWIEKSGVALVMHGGYDSQRDRGWSNLEWFLRDGSCWRRSRERIEQVAWTQAEMSATLRKAGFDRDPHIRCYALLYRRS
jgi:SAM-dependent methyltransferase